MAGSGTGTISISAAAMPSASVSINVVPAATARFVFATPASEVAGTPFPFSSTAEDPFGNIVTGYRGKVNFSTTATNAGLPSDFTFRNNDNGVHVFGVTLNTLGLQAVPVTDTTDSSIIGAVIVDVVAQSSGGGAGGSGGGTGGP